MSHKLNRDAYEKDLIAGNLAWLEKQPRTLERDHIIMIVKASAGHEYGDTARERDDLKRHLAEVTAQQEADYAALADALCWARAMKLDLPKPSQAVAEVVAKLAELKQALAHRTDAHDVDGRALMAAQARERALLALVRHVVEDQPIDFRRLRAALAAPADYSALCEFAVKVALEAFRRNDDHSQSDTDARDVVDAVLRGDS